MLQLVASGFHLAGQHFVLGQGLAAGAGLGQALLGQAYFAAIGRAVELQDQQHLFFLLAAVAPYALFVERVRDAETEGAHLLGRQRGARSLGGSLLGERSSRRSSTPLFSSLQKP